MNKLQEIVWEEKITKSTGERLKSSQLTHQWRIDLYHLPWIQPLLESRWPQFLLRSVALAGFIFTIVTGLIGSRVGSHNFAIIFVWIAWWTALKLVFIPLGGRSWCSVCPIPMPGECLQQGGIFERRRRGFGLNLRWPKILKGSWLQSGGFLLIGLFSAVTLTDARLTAWIFSGLFGLAIFLSLIFERRAFCSYICPIGGFTGIYAKAAPVEVRVLDTAICAAHSEKTCYINCPWGLYPVALRDSAQCGLCMECLRSCPSANIAVYLRPFGSDLATEHRRVRPSKRLDEAFLALVMLGSALAFSAVFTGPWGSLKSAAFSIGSSARVLYGAGFLGLNLLVVPGAFTIAVWTGQRLSKVKSPLPNAIARQAQVLLPLGLFAWMAFTVSLSLPKINTVLTVLSESLGWGWNLFGTANASWAPDVSRFSSVLQVVLVLVGLFWSARVAQKIVKTSTTLNFRQTLPVLGFCLVFSLSMLWMLLG